MGIGMKLYTGALSDSLGVTALKTMASFPLGDVALAAISSPGCCRAP